MFKLRKVYTTWVFNNRVDVDFPPWYLRPVHYWLFSPSIYWCLQVIKVSELVTGILTRGKKDA